MDDLGVYVLEDNLVFMFPTNLRVKALNTEPWVVYDRAFGRVDTIYA